MIKEAYSVMNRVLTCDTLLQQTCSRQAKASLQLETTSFHWVTLAGLSDPETPGAKLEPGAAGAKIP